MKCFFPAALLLLAACAQSPATNDTSSKSAMTDVVADRLEVSDWGSLDCDYWASMGQSMMMAYQARISPQRALDGLKPEVKDKVGKPENIDTLFQIMAGTANYEQHGEPRAKLMAMASYRDAVRNRCLTDRS